jgi:hypothetical protein
MCYTIWISTIGQRIEGSGVTTMTTTTYAP